MSNKFRRITDLFSIGAECYLGDDEEGHPIVVFIMKTSSLHEDEARLDGQAARTGMLLSMTDPMHPEVQNVMITLAEWTDEELHTAVQNQNYESSVTGALADLEADKEWTDKLQYLRRYSSLMDDAQVGDDDPRRVQWTTHNTEYLAKVEELIKERQEKLLAEIKGKSRSEVEDMFMKEYKDKLAVEHYMLESRVTKLYYAVRECDAVKTESGWGHKACDHSKLLMPNRSEVRDLPEDVLVKIAGVFDSLGVGARNVANFQEATNS